MFKKVFIYAIFILGILSQIKCQFDLQDYGVTIEESYKSKMYWGTYKPNLYFAMKNRRNTSDVFGLMWYGSESSNLGSQGNIDKRLRHSCKMEDNLNYRWEQHNGVDFGSQIIEDKENQLKLNTKFIKTHYSNRHNQSWTSLIDGEVKENKKVAVLLYFSMENFEIIEKSYFNLTNFNIDDNVMTFNAYEQGKEKYKYSIKFGKDTKIVDKSIQKYRKRYNETWRVKKFVVDDLKAEEDYYKSKNESYNFIKINSNSLNTNKNVIITPNIVVLQLVFDSNFEILVDFTTLNNKSEEIDTYKDMLKAKETEFNKKFDTIYWSNFLTRDQKPNIPSSEYASLRDMSAQALSNVLGGIGYFYGKIHINLDEKIEKGGYHKGFRYAVENKGLFTGTPSRSFFARGFLWDEGFHNIIISQWDVDISIDIVDSWLSTMSATGWMAREQIRGSEAESTVPAKFIVQDKTIANPPTLIFPVENILSYYKYFSDEKNLKSVNNFLKKCFDKFGSWYEWYENNQKSPDRKSYQWQGRNSEHNLASGLDDYPRGMTPNIYEKHLDLTIWIMELLKSLRNLSELFDFELVSHFEKMYQKIKTDLNKNHFDSERGVYNDFIGPQFKLLISQKHKRKVPPYLWRGDGKCGIEAQNPLGQQAECNPYSDAPCCSEYGWCGKSTGHCSCPKCTKFEKLEDRSAFKEKENIFNPHLGYINLYPIFFGLLKTDEPAFKNTLKLLSSNDELYSNYGIRSLSKSDLLYHTGEDYWRGNIWINLNFLTLRGLFKYYKNDAEAMEIYNKLRNNLIENIFKQWKKNKRFYEQYSDINGDGLRANPFNGWTSLILNIVSEKYDN